MLKVWVNVFLIKNFLKTKTFYFYDRFFVSNQNFTAEYVKIVKIPGFSGIFLNSRFSSFLATLLLSLHLYNKYT